MPNILSLLKISEKQVADVRIDTQPGTAVVLSFETYLRIHSAGSYEFKLTQSAGSSSSSELWINGIRVAGCMCCASQGGTITLPAGRQHLKVVFSGDGWGDSIALSYKGADTSNVEQWVPAAAYEDGVPCCPTSFLQRWMKRSFQKRMEVDS